MHHTPLQTYHDFPWEWCSNLSCRAFRRIPSNIILQRVGPHLWIPSQVIVWGIVEILQSLVKGPSGWYAARFFLGRASEFLPPWASQTQRLRARVCSAVMESGFIPGSLYILSQWYTSGGEFHHFFKTSWSHSR